ncbi:hypothetical protein KY284_026617 [Solanum tuberosum]|nr:hypothetical protein KY284_026617 [Solanum tuberosum]
MMMLPEVEDNKQDQYYMLINRSKLLVDSFEYIAKLANMPGSFFVEFKEEQAIRPGVLRAWFLLASQEIFNPNNTLLVACPDDNRSFFPNQVNLLHLDYFWFYGRMTVLALTYDLQTGVGFDRVFFVQLAGNGVLLEDIRDADPFLYRGCKEILNMDAETVDQDVLGLTFVCEVESLGLRGEIELCPNGKDTVVDIKNRETYVNLFIQHHYVTSIADHVTYFLEGFSDIVKSMFVELRKMLLFFWTSIKSLTLEGFVGLDSRLSIHKTSEFDDHLPSSHT